LEITKKVNFAEVIPGPDGLEVSILFDNSSDLDLDEAMLAWGGDYENGVTIITKFKLSSIIDTAMEMHEVPGSNGAMHREGKPIFDTLRAELEAMIKKIDGLEFLD
jgi:hypothetical protein